MIDGTTVALWIPQPHNEAKAAMNRLRLIAAELGYTTQRGARPGEGHPGKLLFAIASGEIILIKKE